MDWRPGIWKRNSRCSGPVTKVGVIGAGYMASQFALLFVRRLRVPVVITDLDQAHVDKGVAYIHGEIGKLLEKGRISPDESNRLRALVTGTTDKALFADADWVIEAVFEELGVKQQVFAEIEKFISPDAMTNSRCRIEPLPDTLPLMATL